MEITWEDFEKVQMRVGTIVSAQPFEKARKPAYQLHVDFDNKIGIKKTSAQITRHYNPENLIGKQVIAVINFPPKQIANFMSECLIMGIYDENDDVVLIQPERPVRNGSKVG